MKRYLRRWARFGGRRELLSIIVAAILFLLAILYMAGLYRFA